MTLYRTNEFLEYFCSLDDFCGRQHHCWVDCCWCWLLPQLLSFSPNIQCFSSFRIFATASTTTTKLLRAVVCVRFNILLMVGAFQMQMFTFWYQRQNQIKFVLLKSMWRMLTGQTIQLHLTRKHTPFSWVCSVCLQTYAYSLTYLCVSSMQFYTWIMSVVSPTGSTRAAACSIHIQSFWRCVQWHLYTINSQSPRCATA